MTVSLFTFVDMYDRALTTASSLLTKGLEHGAANGVTETEVLGWRLIDDMLPLGFQLAIVVIFSRQWPARVAGLPIPEGIAFDLDAAGLQAAIADSKAYLAALTPEQFDSRDDLPLTYKIADQMEPTLPASRWLTGFATTNIYFHLSTTYAILRAHGVPIGKADMFAGGL